VAADLATQHIRHDLAEAVHSALRAAVRALMNGSRANIAFAGARGR
jgi:hypothetical protein